MGQKTNPIGNRLGIIRGWESNWYGGKSFGNLIAEDDKIRKYVFTRLAKASVSRVIIERTLKLITITITTARPGIIIGKAGQEVDKLKEELKKLSGKDVQLNIVEIKRPELEAQLVASSIARQIENRISYRRAIKMAKRNLDKVLKISEYFSKNSSKYPIQIVLSNLYSYYTKIFQIHTLNKSNNTEISQKLGVNPFFVNDFKNASMNINMKETVKILNIIKGYDLKSKGISTITENNKVLTQLALEILG